MRHDVLRNAEKYTKVHKRKRLWHRVVTVLAGVVVFCTTYALILPAITLEKQCDIPEHTHTDACYAQVTSVEKRVPVCSAETLEIHRHTADCYDANGNPTCGYADFVVHSHDSTCYDENGVLWCPLPEVEVHQHTESCYAVPETEASAELHTHTDACYTMERGELTCGQHVHTDECYRETTVLICGLEESEGHQHNESCQNENGEIVCGIEASEGHHHSDSCYETHREQICGFESNHQHSDDCYAWSKVLICGLSTEPAKEKEPAEPELICEKEEIVLHEHTLEECYQQDESDPDAEPILTCEKTVVLEHVHSDSCFRTVEEPADTETLTCGLTEGEGAHTHDNSCRDENGELVCPLEESAGHQHSPLCYGTWELVCGLEEHTHTLACYSDANADVETAADWEQTFADVTLTGDWAQDVLAIAGTQLDYAESTKNYIVLPDGETMKGYTRYGDWYGQTIEDPNAMYGDWDAMFVSFCLNYAGVNVISPESDSEAWVQLLSDEEYDLYVPASEDDPWPGNLIFFDREPELEEGAEPVADHVGLVAEVILGEGDSPAQIKVIEGDASAEDGSPDAVHYVTYELDDPSILGYAFLPVNPDEGAALLSTGGIPDTLYLNIDSIDWGIAGAHIVLAYKPNNSADWKFAEMTKESDKIYRIALPEDMDKNDSAFRFVRMKDSGIFSWDNQWNAAPTAPSQNLSLVQDKNCFRLTGWNEGQWEDSWYTPAGGTGETRKIYYDATLSKLSYNGDWGTNTIPMANGNSEGDKVYCRWSNSTSSGNVPMTRDHDDVYWADIPTDANHVLFYSSGDGNVPSGGSNMTEEQAIPDTLKSPCFYGDTSDSAIYESANRSGYWGEVNAIRDAEAGKNKTVVDITAGTQTKSNDILYVNTTLYDYYTDYELNGNNRDEYADNVNSNSHRVYQPFRQFNQALSTYYGTNSTSHPLYWGNFQNYNGSHFNEISGTLNLYGSGDKQKFFAENNSMWGYDGSDVGNAGAQATQKLVDSTLSSGTLTMGGVAAPFFSESFLSGYNAKNTVLGKVYHNVSFPFVKQNIGDNGVEYWCFDSSQTNMANSNLQLRQNGGSYFLQPTNSVVRGCTTGGAADPGYFPFNTDDQSGNATRLNYGFGQRFDIQFRLTADGTVTDSRGNKVPVEFNFSGDDDVWVFVDGQLVLDIGGDHGRVDGTINFQDRTSKVSRVKNPGNGTTADVTTGFPDALQGGDFYSSEHTLTMFYMERGLWESNMKITFNFPDESLLEVEKQVNTANVNSLFKSLFNNKDLFTFNIKTLATHFGTKAASGTTSAPVPVALTGGLSTVSSDITFDHTIKYSPVGTNPDEILRWCCAVDDNDSSHRSERYGQLALSGPVSLSGQQYLQFDFWFNWNETPSLSKLFVDLRDENGTSLTREYLSVSSCVSGSPVMAQNQWITLKLDLDKMGVNRSGTVNCIRIGYDLGRNVYIRNMSFQPATVIQSSQVGFVTPQNDIPDYGTASTGQLAIPENAVYTSSRGQSYRIGTDGTFTLQNGETVTFHDQFRRGSYMYLEEDTNPLYTTTWSMYEGMNQSPVSTSTVPSGATTVGGGGQNMSNVSGSIVTDGRVEKASPVAGESDTNGNKYQTNGQNQAPGSTFVFRHYSGPDNTTTTTKLTVKFTNTVNTGSLTIAKAQTGDSEDLGQQEFTFYVEFYNVGGMGLEGDKPIIDGPYTIAVGGSQTITGIPVGTNFTIHEVKPEDTEIVLDNVNGIRPGTGTVKGSTTYTVTGSIPTDGIAQSYTFYNSKKSVVSLTVCKAWISMQGNEMSQNLPTSISVQLQRTTNGTNWEPVSGYGNVTLAPGYSTWQQYRHTFRDLDRYASDKATEYQYRVVELDSDGKVVVDSVTLDDRQFSVTYSEVTDSPENNAPPAYEQTITNKEQPTGYELPDTGGAGTTSYTAGGLALIFGAAALLYSHCKRRKEDEASS